MLTLSDIYMFIKDSMFGLNTEYRYRNNAKMAHTGWYGGNERWQGTVINCD